MTDKNYRMSKSLKTMLWSMVKDADRPVYRKLFAESEQHASTVRKKMSIKVVDVEDNE